MWRSIRQNISRWPATSHRAMYQAKNSAHHFVAEEDLCEAVGDFNAVQASGSSNETIVQGSPQFAAQ